MIVETQIRAEQKLPKEIITSEELLFWNQRYKIGARFGRALIIFIAPIPKFAVWELFPEGASAV